MNGDCILPEGSIVQRFYQFPDTASWDCELLSEESVSEIAQSLYAYISSDERNQEKLGFWFSANTLEVGFSDKTQSVHDLGLPLEGYISSRDRPNEQEVFVLS